MKVFAIAAVCLILGNCAWAAPSVQDNKIESDSTLTRAARYLGSCFESDDMATCLAVKGITALNRAARSNSIELINGVSFKRNPAGNGQVSARAMSENEIVAQLPENAEERTGKLVDMAIESTSELFGSHTLEVKVPTEATQELARALDEGRAKLKKKLGPIALILGAKAFILVPLLLGGLFLLTTKAIIVAKIALFLALLAGGSGIFGGIGKKFSGALGGYNANTDWNSASSGSWSGASPSAYPYARSLGDGHQLAYAGQRKAE